MYIKCIKNSLKRCSLNVAFFIFSTLSQCVEFPPLSLFLPPSREGEIGIHPVVVFFSMHLENFHNDDFRVSRHQVPIVFHQDGTGHQVSFNSAVPSALCP